MYLNNNWYGHRSLLAEYCGIKDANAFVSILHALILFIFTKDLGRRSLNSAHFLPWNKKIKSWYLNHNFKNIVSISSPFIYLHLMNTKTIYLFLLASTFFSLFYLLKDLLLLVLLPCLSLKYLS